MLYIPKAFLVLAAAAFGVSAVLAGPAPANRIVMQAKLGDLEPSEVKGGTARQPMIFEFEGKRVKTVAEFKEAVESLPRGAELFWDSGCIRYDHLPVAGSPAKIEELQRFCAARGVAFKYVCGW